MESNNKSANLDIIIENERLNSKMVQINYFLSGCLLIALGFLGYQIYLAKENVTVEEATIVRLQLEGAGVIEQSHDLALRQENAQQTVVFTELNTKNGAPITVSVSTDTIDKEDNHVVN